VPADYLDRDWRFSKKSRHLSPEVMSIVAKSDFLRMYLVGEHGGGWIDADTIVIRDYRSELAHLLGDKLLWHSEQFFYANQGNALLKNAAKSMLVADQLVWGDPGRIKLAVQANKPEIDFVPVEFFDPGYRPTYNAGAYEIMFRKDVEVEDFLVNDAQRIQKMYHSSFVRFIPRETPVAEFLAEGTLLSKILLSVDGDTARWDADCAEIRECLR
jgi:hypothetical protein